MADFVDCDLSETEPANESIDVFHNDEPPAKKRRGANIKYKYVEEVESSDDLKQKANVAGLTKINTQNGNVYYECKNPSCCYKWKAKRTYEFKYLIYETEYAHDHENAERKTGLTKDMKDIVDKRMSGNERVNANAVIQAFLNAGIKKLPTSVQINNYVSHKKRTLKLTPALSRT
uniref:FLYWCH-type domain-containing protein n=1 Tax=Panagrolaimus davidi TaxID=227884 RepID=A0A914Q1F5_9BILA